jgi:ion channel-forming bestrophin family protein
VINYNPKSWIKLIFAIHKSDTIQILWKELLYVGAFTLFIAYLQLSYFPKAYHMEKLITVYSLIGFVISLLLVFRTNTAYDRWWEGRKKWGCLVNDTRNFAIKLASMLQDENDREYFRRMIPNFVFASKEHLREGVLFEEMELHSEERDFLMHKNHVPVAINLLMYKRLQQLKNDHKITQEEYLALDHNINAFLDSLGGCERIKNTPIPFSYSLFLKKFIFIYVTTLPLAFVSIFGYFSALIATFVFYVLVSMEVLAEEIEDPFGRDDNDLPTDTLCEKIRNNVYEVLS